MAFLLPTPLTPLAKASIRADLQVFWRIPVSHCPTARSLPVVSARSSSCMRLGYNSASVRVRSLVAFWLLAFFITWALGMVVVLSKQAGFINGARVRPGAYDLPFGLTVALLFLQAFGPAIAAGAVSAWEAGGRGVAHLLRQVLRWRADPRSYLLALLLPAVLTLLAAAIWATSAASFPRTGCSWHPPSSSSRCPSAPGEKRLAGADSPNPGSRSGCPGRWPRSRSA